MASPARNSWTCGPFSVETMAFSKALSQGFWDFRTTFSPGSYVFERSPATGGNARARSRCPRPRMTDPTANQTCLRQHRRKA